MNVAVIAHKKIGNYFTSVVLIPALFFLVYAGLNFKTFLNPGLEDGDLSSGALQIIRAKNFEEYLGPYSRFEFNHPGPISFYYYAFMEGPLFFIPSPFGRHLAAQFLLNIFFLFLSLHILYISLKKKFLIPMFFIVMLLCLYPHQPNIFMRMWPPALLIFPTILFTLAMAKFSSGDLRFLFWAVVSSVFIVHNNLSGLAIVGPFTIIGLVLFAWNRRKSLKSSKKETARLKKGSSVNHEEPEHPVPGARPTPLDRDFSGSSWKILAACLVFLMVSFLPPLYEQFSADKGNLTKIYEFYKNQSGLQHPFLEACRYIFDFYAAPVQSVVPINPFLVVLVLTVGSLSLVKKKGGFMNILVLFNFAGMTFSILGAMTVTGRLMPYIFKYEVAFTGLMVFTFLAALLTRVRISSPWQAALLIVVLGAMGPVSHHFYKLQARSPDPKYDDIIKALHPEKGFTYELFWRKGGPHYGQWGTATRLALKLIRQGYDVRVPEEWSFMFGKKLVSPAAGNVRRIALYSPEAYRPQVREYVFPVEGTIVEFGELIPLSIPLAIGFDSSDEYFPNWPIAGENGRNAGAGRCWIRIPLGRLEPGANYVLRIEALSPENKTTKILVNGISLAETSFNSLSGEVKHFYFKADFLKNQAANLVEFVDLLSFRSLAILPDGPGSAPVYPFVLAIPSSRAMSSSTAGRAEADTQLARK